MAKANLPTVVIAAALGWSTAAAASPGPAPLPEPPAISAPQDVAFPGVIRLAVDATDVQRRILRVHETIPVAPGQPMVLLYPKWLPGTHAPEGAIDRFAGLKISADGVAVPWVRDTVDVYAFHLTPPAGARQIEVEFQYLSPVNGGVGPTEHSGRVAMIEWISLALYPAGYFTRDIPVEASLTLPDGWAFATALDKVETRGPVTTFRQAPLETVADSPVYAGLYTKTLDLPRRGRPRRG